MELTISPKAHAWFKKEIILNPGQGIRFFWKSLWQHPSS
ncbi:iron-sulfur cluster biosynthesis protein [Enterococcus cecorum]|nr:iron-sulfur cluster biosynthesis protein [Enterococcus cecorum]CAI3257568.1 iron-sulfur cluster biosynthesis protein [Enterococcus cecorum]CAI3258334.1 iron-sulfur cluster biosynthesis protein [Enterococcus cecorum]CAI3282241.1 iron-sulfur cluster biosynthesis protein [Enterococcus cecorum]CAI3282406.1 iron-sulfur cluster biosynthesis protein [Enterococcus cecorum]